MGVILIVMMMRQGIGMAENTTGLDLKVLDIVL